MKKIFYAVSIIAVLFSALSSCKSKSKPKAQDNPAVIETVEEETANAVDAAHSSRNSLDWNGDYTGVIPCADCQGINVKITLNPDETYQISYQYIDRDKTPVTVSGKFKWNKAGSIITLDCKDFPPHYKVGENRLFQLDAKGKPVAGEHANKYELTKTE